MKITFRPVRSTLEESLKDRITANSLRSLLIKLVLSYNSNFSIEELTISYGGYDSRIGWTYYYVCSSRFGSQKYSIPQIIGYLTFGE